MYDKMIPSWLTSSVHTAKHCPSAMIFIRCKDGISHHPSEFSTAEDM